MAITKVSRGLLSTGISDSSDATAITIDSSENITLGVTNPVQISTNIMHGTSGSNGFYVRTALSSATVPTFSNIDDTNTGMFFPAADTVGFTTAGTERARFTSNGLTFNGDTAAANALDDYEEGSWTPTIIGDGGASGQSYSIQYGAYTRIGNFVHMTFDVRLTALGTLSGTYVHIGGHGFTFKGNNIGGSALIGYVANVSNSNHYPLNAYLHATGVYLMQGGNGYITTAAAGGNFINSNTILIGTITGLLA